MRNLANLDELQPNQLRVCWRNGLVDLVMRHPVDAHGHPLGLDRRILAMGILDAPRPIDGDWLVVVAARRQKHRQCRHYLEVTVSPHGEAEH